MNDLPWVKLGALAPGTLFLTRDREMGQVFLHGDGKEVAVRLLDANYTQGLPSDLEVLPVNPLHLADDLAELALAREALADRREECEALLRQERAKALGEAAEEMERRAGDAQSGAYNLLPGTLRDGLARFCNESADALRALAPAPVPERCDRLTRQVEALRAALEEIAKLDQGVRRSAEIARKALEEGAPIMPNAGQLRAALLGLANTVDGQPCWCGANPYPQHSARCLAARKALKEVMP